LLLAAAIAIAVTACGGSSDSNRTGYPTINFVGNASCPTDGANPYSPMPPNVNSLPPVGVAVDEMPHTHVSTGTKVNYNHNPPTSGCHYNLGYGTAPIQSGAYNQVIQPEYWVHNLEHGYIAVLYNCPTGADCTTLQHSLENYVRNLAPAEPTFNEVKVVLTPYSKGMTQKVALVAWDYIEFLDVYDQAAITRFYENHANKGPENIA